MSRVLQVAFREFLATVATKGFIIGILLTPLIGLAALVAIGLAERAERPPRVDGELAVIDPTGRAIAGVAEYLAPEAIARRWSEKLRDDVDRATPEPIRRLRGQSGVGPAVDAAMAAALGDAPTIAVERLADDASVEVEKDALRAGSVGDAGRLALAVVDADAVERKPGDEQYGRFELYVRDGLDPRVQEEIEDGLRRAIVDARIAALGLDREEIASLTRVGRIRTTTVTERGEKESHRALNFILPLGFMILLLVSVMSGGQYLMTTTIEEKSSRVVEILLSAVSPMQLMSGKILGQMCVGFLILAVYAGLGIAALLSFAMLGFVDPWHFVYLILFFLIAYFTMGSLLAAIGAAVNELREAQTLMTPVVLSMMIPWLFWMPIVRDPNSVFSTVVSFLPPINTFAMLLRLTTPTPPPDWQVWLSILVGVLTVWATMWFAAKVFRVGLLMYGKPPNFATLVRWVRMA